MFQFLIGTLETRDDFLTIKCISEFQFLIGTLETFQKHIDVRHRTGMFQFLIGTLETDLAMAISEQCYGCFNSS